MIPRGRVWSRMGRWLFLLVKHGIIEAFLEEVGKEQAPRGQLGRIFWLGIWGSHNKHYTQKFASFFWTLGKRVRIDCRLCCVDANY